MNPTSHLRRPTPNVRPSATPARAGRHRRLRTGLVVAIALALGACAPAPDLAKEEAAVRAVSARWLQLEKGRDAAGIAGLFAPDATLYRERRDPLAGTAAIQSYIAGQYQSNPRQVVDWTTDRVDVAASGDLATEYGTWTERNSGPDGRGQNRGRYITSFRKVNGEWKVVADMSIATTPAAVPAAAAAAPTPST